MTMDEFVVFLQQKTIKFEQGTSTFEEALYIAQMIKDEEEFLKVNDPAVKDAWEQYQIVLTLRRRS